MNAPAPKFMIETAWRERIFTTGAEVSFHVFEQGGLHASAPGRIVSPLDILGLDPPPNPGAK